MNACIASLELSFRSIIGLILFPLLLVVIFETLQSKSRFQGITALIIAYCVTILALLGMGDFFLVEEIPVKSLPQPVAREKHLDFLLLPYVAMALSILGTLLLWAIFKLFRRRDKQKVTIPPIQEPLPRQGKNQEQADHKISRLDVRPPSAPANNTPDKTRSDSRKKDRKLY